MTWNIENRPHRVYSRNPLVSTHVEIRYFPLLKVQTEFASFQEVVRSKLPGYELIKAQEVHLQPQKGEIKVSETDQHTFIDPTRHHRLILTTESLVYSSTAHQNKEQLLEFVNLGLTALESVFGDYQTTRLGVRYVNIIDKQVINEGLNSQLDWDNLISDEYLKQPHEIANLQATNFNTQIRSDINNNGMLSLNYGLTQNAEGIKEHFRFDIDRYIEPAPAPAGIPAQIEQFTLDIFSLFETMATDTLRGWMDQ